MAEQATEARPALVRDSDFVRIAADRSIAFFLGRDVEIALVSFSPQVRPVDDPHSETADAIRIAFQAEYQLIEVARLRMSPDGAIGMALSIIDQLVTAGLVDDDRLRGFVSQMVEAAPADGDISPEDHDAH